MTTSLFESSELLRDLRKNNKELRELEMQTKNEYLQDLWKQKQKLILEMNQAKKQAAEQAAEPYLVMINELDQEYTAILALST